VVVHDIVVVGPITATNLSLSKGLAAERARTVLADSTFDKSLEKLCDCVRDLAAAVPEAAEVIIADDTTPLKLTDETEEGFAAIAKQKLLDGETESAHDRDEYDDDVVDMDVEDD
jgi:endoribonuclease Dicer